MSDWRALVREHGRRAGVDLPAATVEELALHLEDTETAALEDGATSADAYARAMRALRESTLAGLGGHASRDANRPRARRAEDTARAAGGRSLHLFSAIRTAARQFRHHPGFASVTVLVLGVGTAAATTVFTVVDSVVLRPLPYREPASLVALWDTNYQKGLAHDPISPVNFMDYRALPVFESAAAWWRPSLNLIDPGLEPVRVNAIEARRDPAYRARRDAGAVPVPGRHRRLAAAAMGSREAQPRCSLHGGGGAPRAGDVHGAGPGGGGRARGTAPG